MSERSDTSGPGKPPKPAAPSGREARLAKALRDNLRRRKAAERDPDGRSSEG